MQESAKRNTKTRTASTPRSGHQPTILLLRPERYVVWPSSTVQSENSGCLVRRSLGRTAIRGALTFGSPKSFACRGAELKDRTRAQNLLDFTLPRGSA